MQFNNVRAERDRPIDLFAKRIDEQAHADAGSVKPFHRRRQLFPMGDDIEASFRRDFLPFLRNEAHFIRHNPQCDIDDLRGVAQLEIELRHDIFAQPLDVAIHDVPPVRAQMRRDSMSSRAFADARDRHRVGLGVFRIRHRRITRLPQRRDVINIYSKLKSFHGMLNRFQTERRGKRETPSSRAERKRSRGTPVHVERLVTGSLGPPKAQSG